MSTEKLELIVAINGALAGILVIFTVVVKIVEVLSWAQ